MIRPLYILILNLFLTSLVNAQSASALWELSSTTTTSVFVDGNISGQDESFNGMTINNYSGPNSSQRVTTLNGEWPAESDQNESRYIQFAVSPENGFYLSITSIEMDLGAAGGGNMRANIWYSKEPSFSNATKLNSSVLVLPNGAFISPSPNYSINVIVDDGETFYLRIYPWYTTSSTGKYVCPQDVTISGTTVSTSAIFPSVNSLDLGAVVAGNTTPSVQYSVYGTNLNENVVIKAPVNFKVSSDNFTFLDSIVLPLIGNSLPATDVFVRFNPASASGTINGILTHTSGEISENFSISGTALAAEPTVSSNITFGTVTGNSITVNFSGGNGSNRILVVKSGSEVNWEPVDGNIINGVNNNFILAADQGNGNKVIYNGSGSNVTVTGLTGNTTYYFAVYEYNAETNNSHNYFTSSPGTGNQTTEPAPTIAVVPSSLSFGNVNVNTISSEKTYSLSANTLSPSSGNIMVTAPQNFEISLTSGSGFSSSVQVPYSDGLLNNTTIYVRFLPTNLTAYSGSITNSGGNAQTQNVLVSGNGISPGEPNVLQAEDALLFSSYVRTQYSGYTGAGYVDLADRTGSYLEFIFRREEAATNIITVYYANGGTSRSLSVSLNDAVISSLSFPSTGNWTTWSSVTVSVPMVSGINRLRFSSTTNNTNPNIDRILIGGSEAFPVYKLTLTKSGLGTVSALPLKTYYEAGEQVTFTAFPSTGNSFFRWAGTENNFTNPYIITMNSHKTVIGIMMDTTGITTFPYELNPRGFASVGSLGYSNGTTGGAGNEAGIAFVTTSTELVNLMYSRVDVNNTGNLPPLTVYIIGTLFRDSGISTMIDIKDAYNISIIGVGGDAAFSGVGLKIVRSSNIIVRNILFINAPDDGISIQADDTEATGNHIWIDHCSFTNSYDGALDVTHTASYVTLSWNHFYNNDKTSLMGHSDNQVSDTAMKVTYHHNFFDGTRQRHPRVRFGKAHVFNNYYLGAVNTIYGVSSNMNAQVMVEGNYFNNVAIPTETSRDGSPQGNLVERQNIFIDCGIPGTGGTVFEPSGFYSYSLDNAANVPGLLMNHAGSGKYDFSLNDTVSIPTFPAELLSFSAEAISSSQINLSFTPNESNDNVVILWNNTGEFTIPSGTPPSIGSPFAGGILLYNGTSSPQMHSGLAASTNYFYKAFSYNGIYFSSGLTDEAVTQPSSSTFQLTVSVENGWNMVSIPGLLPTNQNVTTWWSGKDPSANVFKFSESYQSVTTASPGEGYWVKNLGAQTYNTGDEWPQEGIFFVSHNPIEALEGWNLIGGYEYNAQVSGITTNPSGLNEGPVFKYSNGYLQVSELEPGYGYWIKLSDAGQIILPSPSFKGTPKIAGTDNKQDWGRIIITDYEGRKYTLYAVEGNVNLNAYELPPPPPAGMFDVRYETGRFAENFNSGVQQISMSSMVYPVTIKAENIDLRLQDVTGKIINEELIDGEEITINQNNIDKLNVSLNIIPDKFSLEQNYPNPFNPSTIIEFSIPADIKNVTLSVYNVLGEKVAELISGSFEPGYYKYEWNAANLASGLYIYELRTEKSVAVKKMMLLK